MRIYGKLIHRYFEKEQSNLLKFMELFLASVSKMTEKDPPDLDNLTKFAVDFESRIGVSQSEIIERFRLFYQSDFEQVCRIMATPPIVKTLISLASKHFLLVAATSPFFPSIANEKRLNIGGLDIVPWFEITSAEDYHFTKPHIEFFEELLNRISKEPSECIMVGDDLINDMVAGKLGIKTFLVKSAGRPFGLITRAQPDFKDTDFPANYTGTLEDFYNSMKMFVESK